METKIKYVLYISILFLWACGSKKQNSETVENVSVNENEVLLTEAQFKNSGIATEFPHKSRGAQYITVKGQVEAPPQNHISISTPLGGYVKQIKLHIGDKVKKGETVAVLEDLQFIQLQQDYLMGKTKITQLQAEYERQESLSKTQASSLKQAELAKADFENQKVILRALSEKLTMLGINSETLTSDNIRAAISIKSPVNGFVTVIHSNMGKYVSATEMIMEMVDPSDIHLSLRVFEKDLPFLRIGQKITAYTNNQPDKKYEANVVLIGKSILADKSVEVHGHFHDIPPELIPGLYMNAVIEAESQDGFSIQQDAIINEDGKEYVFVDKGNNQYQLSPISVLWTQNDSTGFLFKDVSAQKNKVVTKNAYQLFMQLRNKAE